MGPVVVVGVVGERKWEGSPMGLEERCPSSLLQVP